MKKHMINVILLLATLWIVPYAMGRWINSHDGEAVKHSSLVARYDYSLFQYSSEENRINLIELTIEHYNPYLDEEIQQSIISEIIKSSKDNNLDPFLVTAVIAAESSFKPNAKSHCGARGLMQLTRVVLPALGVSDPFNIEQNIEGGCKFLGELYRRFGNTTLALAAYNAGPTRVARLKRVPRITETQNYVRKVQKIATILFNHFLSALEINTFNPIAYIKSNTFQTSQQLLVLQFTNYSHEEASLIKGTDYNEDTIPAYMDNPSKSLSTKLVQGPLYSNELVFSSENYFG